jgi:hypothetical protein
MTDVVLFDSQVKFVNEDGILTDIAFLYLDQLWQRSGAFTDTGIAPAVSGDIGLLSFGAEETEEPILDSRVIDLQKSLKDLSIDFEQILDHRSLIQQQTKNLLGFKVVSVTEPITAQVNRIYLCDGTFTITLPSVSLNNEKQLYIKNVGAGIITIKGDGFELVEGMNEQELTVQDDAILLVNNKVKWFVL